MREKCPVLGKTFNLLLNYLMTVLQCKKKKSVSSVFLSANRIGIDTEDLI